MHWSLFNYEIKTIQFNWRKFVSSDNHKFSLVQDNQEESSTEYQRSRESQSNNKWIIYIKKSRHFYIYKDSLQIRDIHIRIALICFWCINWCIMEISRMLMISLQAFYNVRMSWGFLLLMWWRQTFPSVKNWQFKN